MSLSKEATVSLLKQAYQLATESPDPSTQNAALLVDRGGRVLVTATNRFPDGVVENQERWERPLKYSFVVHAERNVICVAARQGVATKGLTMVCPWAACPECAQAIIQAGIKTLIVHQQAVDRPATRWSWGIALAKTMFDEAEVEYYQHDGSIGGVTIRFDSQPWNP